MGFNRQDLPFNESDDLIIEFITTVGSATAMDVRILDMRDSGVLFEGVVPADQNTIYTVFVPWSNVRSIRQDRSAS